MASQFLRNLLGNTTSRTASSSVPASAIAGSSQLGDLQTWLDGMIVEDDIFLMSRNRPYQHPEGAYDGQYNFAAIEKTIGTYILDQAGFVPHVCLELACGTGHLTGSLLHDGRVQRLIASDASEEFLRITRSKVSGLPSKDRLTLLRLADSEFADIPVGVFDAIFMRSALHHFADFKGCATTLIERLRPGGALFMLEPRADFHIAGSLVLKSARSRGLAKGVAWSPAHDHIVDLFVACAQFYLARGIDKSTAEDKYVFHVDELADIAATTGTEFLRLGGEYPSTFSRNLEDYLIFCMSYDQGPLKEVMALATEDLEFLDRVYAPFPRYAAAEWFVFRKKP